VGRLCGVARVVGLGAQALDRAALAAEHIERAGRESFSIVGAASLPTEIRWLRRLFSSQSRGTDFLPSSCIFSSNLLVDT